MPVGCILIVFAGLTCLAGAGLTGTLANYYNRPRTDA
ncbi:hypothetical protein BH24ACT14_BH24ACT14_18860 [soil metagenome]